MFNLGFVEVIIILVGVSILFFGGKKISEFGKGLGRFSGEFKKGKQEVEKEINELEKTAKT